MTFPASDAQAHASVNFPGTIVPGPSGAQPTVTYTEGLDVGYRWYDAMGQTPLFPFGYGLSYTTFRYSGLQVAPAGRGAEVRVRVTNTGRRAGAAVVSFTLGPSALSVWDGGSGGWVLRPGTYRAMIGDSSSDIRASAAFALH
jgi:beta-glucosidase